MLKITIQTETRSTRLKLEGRLTGPWVEELRRCWDAAANVVAGDVIVDLTGVTYIDARGKALMTRMWEGGARFHAVGCLTRSIVDEIADTAGGCASHWSRRGGAKRG
jgi:hypothetical protein